ncbi:hypothetical protein V3W47_18890 [Deinococcus sp. YIM 134068]|uniref:hypothetical protein n=1 Tax=Deinococcus lichenicola TaxID=3118910 RepID=UPI002F93036F
MAVHHTLSGFTAWQVLDAAGRTVARGERHNLITDAGLDAFANENGRGVAAPNVRYGGFRNTLRVGTGSTAPSATKTSLGSEVANGGGTGGFDAEQIETVGVVGNELVGTFRTVRVVNFTAAYNVTEYGLASGTSSSLSITELFRDAQGNPVAVPVQAGYQLKLTHDLTIRLPYVAVPGVLNVGGGDLATLTTYCTSGVSSSRFSDALQAFAPGEPGDLVILTAPDTGAPNTISAYATVSVTRALQPYVAGSRRRVKRYEIAPSAGNYDHHGYVFLWTTTGNGFKLAFQNGAKITKNSSQKLTFDYAVTWGRA